MENVDKQDLVECPYDKHHVILKTRMAVHLTRCRRNYPNSKKVTCPFNVTHVLNQPELELHVTICPERQTMENFRNATAHVTQPTKVPQMPEFYTDENWDDEPDVASYNPQAYASKADILRTIQGATPSERKEFRRQERRRLQNLK